MIDLYNGKIGYCGVPKCGTRTVISYAYLLRYPNAITEHPEWFGELGEAPLWKSIPIIKFPIPKKLLPPVIFCIVRDPVERFVSAYFHRIYTLNKVNYNYRMSITEFIDTLEERKNLPEYTDINNHIQSLVFCLGKKPLHYSNIFNMRQMDKVKELIENVSGNKLPNIHLYNHKSFIIDHKKINKPTLTDEQILWIKNRYKEDYDIYGQWF